MSSVPKRGETKAVLPEQVARAVEYTSTVHDIGADIYAPGAVPLDGWISYDWHLLKCKICDDRIIVVWYRVSAEAKS